MRNDIEATAEYRRTMQNYGIGKLKSSGADVNSPQQAKQIASQRSGQSENNDKESRAKNAMRHPDVYGAGAAKRRNLPPKERPAVAVKEYERGTLNSGSGHRATSKAQALAIGYSEARKNKRKDLYEQLNSKK